MNDELLNPRDYLRERLKQLMVLLDEQDLPTAAALVAQAIDVIPANDDR